MNAREAGRCAHRPKRPAPRLLNLLQRRAPDHLLPLGGEFVDEMWMSFSFGMRRDFGLVRPPLTATKAPTE